MTIAPNASSTSTSDHNIHGLSGAGTALVCVTCTVPAALAVHGAGVPAGMHVALTAATTEAMLVMLAGGVAATVTVTV